MALVGHSLQSFNEVSMSYVLPCVMHQSFVTTAHPPTGEGRDYDFSAFSAPPPGDKLEVKVSLCPALRNGKSPWGKDPNVKTPSFPLYCGDSQKVTARHFSPAIPHPFPVGWGGGGGGGGNGYK